MMTGSRLTGPLDRRSALAAIGGSVAGFSLALLGGWSQLNASEQPRIVVMGSGRALSVLLQSGPARVVIVSGHDGADFGNALASSTTALLRRVDIAIVDGTAMTAGMVRTAMQRLQPRATFAIRGSTRLADAGIRIERELFQPTAFELPGDMQLVAPAADILPPAPTPVDAWSAIVRWSGHAILLDAGSREARRGGEPIAPSIWIRLHGRITDRSLREIRPRCLVAPAQAIEGRTLRNALIDAELQDTIGYRVHDGDALTITRTTDGLRPDGVPSYLPRATAVAQRARDG